MQVPFAHCHSERPFVDTSARRAIIIPPITTKLVTKLICMVQIVRCPRFEQDYLENSRYCTNCGAALPYASDSGPGSASAAFPGAGSGRPAQGSTKKKIGIGLGVAGVAVVAVVVGFLIWFITLPISGVKFANEMADYALEYIEEHNLLNGSENLLAYYDVIFRMTGTEAAILTTERVMYHKDGRTTWIALRDVVDVQHRQESTIGDIMEVSGGDGTWLKIEIPPLNEGPSFHRALLDAWSRAGQGY